jgi:hypothetical protein
MPVNVTSVDTRTVEFRAPLSCEETEQVGKLLANGGQDGYAVNAVTTLYSGNQRDEYVVGVRIVLKKVP